MCQAAIMAAGMDCMFELLKAICFAGTKLRLLFFLAKKCSKHQEKNQKHFKSAKNQPKISQKSEILRQNALQKQSTRHSSLHLVTYL